jgi:hypothetical protein
MNPLREALRERSEAQFRRGVELSDVMSVAVQQVARKRKLRNTEVLDAQLTALSSCVQAMAPEAEWDDIGAILAEELRARLTVKQVN